MAGGVDALLLLDGGALVLHLEAGHVPALLVLPVLTAGLLDQPALLVLHGLTLLLADVFIPAANISLSRANDGQCGSPCLAFVLRHQLTLVPHNLPAQRLLHLAAVRLQPGLVDGLALLLADRVAALHVQLDAVGVLVGGADLVGLVGADVVALRLQETLVVLVDGRPHQAALPGVGWRLVVVHVMLVVLVVMVVMMGFVMLVMSVVVVVVSSSLEVRPGYGEGGGCEGEN